MSCLSLTRHYDTDTCKYTKLYEFFKLSTVSTYQCLYPCFIVLILMIYSDFFVIILCGYFREKVVIPQNKSYIILKGAGKRKTIVEWYDPDGPERSPTFSILADNIHVRCMSFRVRNFLPLAD